MDGGRALLDTKIITVRGKALRKLVKLACSCLPLILELLKRKKDMRIYEDLVTAWVSIKHDWLQVRPLSEELVIKLGKKRMFSDCVYDLLFLHFGTSSEVLDHLRATDATLVGRRHLCSIPATTVLEIVAYVVLSCKIDDGVSIDEDSLIYDSIISGEIHIGSQSIVVDTHVPKDSDNKADNLVKFMLPDRHCFREVLLVGYIKRVIVFCGIHDNLKIPLTKDETFCGKPWEKVMHDLAIEENDLWSSSSSQEKCLWNAKLFPILSYNDMLSVAMWLIGLSDGGNQYFLPLWRNSPRVSLEELHRSINFLKIYTRSSQADLVAGIKKVCINYGMLGRNLSQLCEKILQNEITRVKISYICFGFDMATGGGNQETVPCDQLEALLPV